MTSRQFATNHPELSTFASVVSLIAIGACMSSSRAPGAGADEVSAPELAAASRDAGPAPGFTVTANEPAPSEPDRVP
jgi:hypothetical protein